MLIEGEKMKAKILRLKPGEEIIIKGNSNEGILVKNGENKLNIREQRAFQDNICIKKLTFSQLTSFVLTKLLESNSAMISDYKIINNLLEEQYNSICGKSYISDEIEKIEFQAITYLKKE